MYLGKIQDKKLKVSQNAPNKSILITGISGSGKSCRMNLIEMDAALTGKTVIVLDTDKTHASNQIYAPISMEYQRYVNRINLQTEGLSMQLPGIVFKADNSSSLYRYFINSLVAAISEPLRMGIMQIGALREALIFAMNNCKYYCDKLSAVIENLKIQDSREADAVLRKLWPLSDINLIREDGKKILKGRIYILYLEDTDRITKKIISEILLSILWFYKKSEQTSANDIVLAVDEFQNLRLKEGCLVWDVLREGRKFGLSIILATQTLDTFTRENVAILNQAAVRLYFLPAKQEIRKCAKSIDPLAVEYWVRRLSNLRVGEAVAVGYTNIEGIDISRPVLTK